MGQTKHMTSLGVAASELSIAELNCTACVLKLNWVMGIKLNCTASVSLDGDHIEADEDLSFVVQPVGLVQVPKPFLEAGKLISGLPARQVLAPGGESHLHIPNVCNTT